MLTFLILINRYRYKIINFKPYYEKTIFNQPTNQPTYQSWRKLLIHKNFIKFLSIFIFFSIIVTSCNEEDIIELESTAGAKSLFTLKMVKLSEIPDINEFLESKTKGIFYKKSIDKNGAIFDQENIMEVIDTMSFKNYSFRFTFPDTPTGTFYNLIVGKTTSGEKIEPIVLKFVSDSLEIDTFIAGNSYFDNFTGNIYVHKYTDYFKNGNFYKSNINCPPNFDANGDPTPCDVIPVEAGGQNSGGGGSSKGGSGQAVSSPGAAGGRTFGGNGGYTLELVKIKSPRFFKSIKTKLKSTTITLSKGNTSNCADCPTKSEGIVGVNSPDYIINNLIGRAKCVYEKLEDTNGNLFKKTIGKFINDPKYNLILKHGNCTTSDNACITGGDDIAITGEVTIIIENNYQAALEMAATILHEGIHAEIYRYVARHEQGIDLENRQLLFDYFAALNGKSGEAQHQYMADTYVKPIAIAIRTLDNDKYPIDYYMAFGWDGLARYAYTGYYDEGVWKELNDDPEYNASFAKQKTVLDNTNFTCN
ncbi:hypothetical protein JYU17_00585 [Flavobacteriaceae bacterium AH-315-O20]|nr:hypothetical protein [Flavobacteriaceae bacterium AH-315-O20]